jgi:hypothetical protein
MIKIITATLFALIVAIIPAQAGPSKRIFAGNYDGIAQLENIVGDRIFYSPVRMKISRTGRITGTAYNDDTQQILKVTGSITKVKSLFGISFIGKASGTFSDGTIWKADVEAQKNVSAKIIRGKVRRNGYSGSLSLTNL